MIVVRQSGIVYLERWKRPECLVSRTALAGPDECQEKEMEAAGTILPILAVIFLATLIRYPFVDWSAHLFVGDRKFYNEIGSAPHEDRPFLQI